MGGNVAARRQRVRQLAAVPHPVGRVGPDRRRRRWSPSCRPECAASSSASRRCRAERRDCGRTARCDGTLTIVRTSGKAREPRDSAARIRGRRSSSHAASSSSAVAAASPSRVRRMKSDRSRKAATIGSILAPKSRSTAANCGSTNTRKNSRTQPAAAARTSDSAARRRSLRRSASPRAARRRALRAIWSSAPDASPTRTSATYIGGNSDGWRDSASAKLSPASTLALILATTGRSRPRSPSVASSSSAVIDPRAGAQQQREIAGKNGDVLGPRPVENDTSSARPHRRRLRQRSRSAPGRDTRCGARPRPLSERISSR